jgi:transposase
VEPARCLAGGIHGADGIVGDGWDDGHRRDPHQSASLGGRRKRGAFVHAIGRSRGGRTTKIHALSDARGRPLAFLLTPGNIADISAAPYILAKVPPPRRLIADKAYDAKSLRDWVAAQGGKAVIPPNPTRKHPARYDAKLYRQRNRIERMFCRLKDFRRLATRYDKRADTFLSAILLVAALVWWVN